MKLLVITAVQEYSKEIKSILKKSGIHIYSYKDVTGFRDLSEESFESNWFAGEMDESQSIIFFAFVKKENVDIFFAKADEFNAKQKTMSKVHVVVLNIEKSN
ncbi:MAG: hypothetical protein CVU08_09345 [Bacteroidetes bacterium HGW-Bacteroidetes-3]|jgi:hypothetical protein|nr:MAG: hypothetical protein CVU08_09345 [Bacteroidetes bacterium HGW-Bacteroidetes-3]